MAPVLFLDHINTYIYGTMTDRIDIVAVAYGQVLRPCRGRNDENPGLAGHSAIFSLSVVVELTVKFNVWGFCYPKRNKRA